MEIYASKLCCVARTNERGFVSSISNFETFNFENNKIQEENFLFFLPGLFFDGKSV